MQQLQRDWIARDVVWLMLSSSAEGAHSYLTPQESRAYLTEQNSTPTAMLLDTDGKVGHLYGAVSRSPHRRDRSSRQSHLQRRYRQRREQSGGGWFHGRELRLAGAYRGTGRTPGVGADLPTRTGCSIHYAGKIKSDA